jgi:DHA1 family inner membrane transport protein
VGVHHTPLPAVVLVGGAATFLRAPRTGRLADRHGARPVLCGTVALAAGLMVLLTHLPAVGLPVAAVVAGLLMASNASRMVAVQVLVAAAVEPRHRSGFLAVNSSVQQLASALGTAGGGLLLAGGPGEPLRHFGTVGLLAAGVTLASLGLAARLPTVAPGGAAPRQYTCSASSWKSSASVMRRCCIESRSRSVKVPSFSIVSKSMVTHQGVPISSCRR